MGSYITLTVDDYTLLYSKSRSDPATMTIFREADKHSRVVRVHADGSPPTRLDKRAPSDFVVDEEDETIEIGYSTPSRVAKDRLDVMGFTLSVTKESFRLGISARLATLRSVADDYPEDRYHDAEIAALSALTFDSWISGFRELKQKGVDPYTKREGIDLSPTAEWMVAKNDCYGLQFPLTDPRYFIRAVTEASGDQAVFTQDLTDVIAGEYHGFDEEVAKESAEALVADFPENTRVVVLTEGKTDRRALEGSLNLLYPHLVGYFAFMDFDAAAVAGGTGPLIATVKAFAGAGIANRVIAIFDNDSAGRSAVRGLQKITLPNSMRVLHYPTLPLANAYPTIGPTGSVTMNVNDLAGSIEMYFGEDVLRQSDGTLTPVVWQNFDEGIKAYQGVLLNKASLQERFEQKLTAAAADPQLLEALDWSGMRLILGHFIGLFSNTPAVADDYF